MSLGNSKLIALNLLIIAVGFLTLGCEDLAPLETSGESEVSSDLLESQTLKDQVVVQFSDEKTIDELDRLSHDLDFEVQEINFKTGDISGGFVLDPSGLITNLQQAQEYHRAEMQALRARMQTELLKDSSSAPAMIQAQLEVFDSLDQEMVITGAVLKMIPETKSQLESYGKISGLADFSRPKVKPAPILDGNQNSLAPSAASSLKSWAPSVGYIKFTPTYMENVFVFNNVSGFNQGYFSTYEHEVHYYPRDVITYNGYWSSNLPFAYKDTEFRDAKSEPEYQNLAIGSFYANIIKPNRIYFTKIGIKKAFNIQPNNKVIIKGQLGFSSLHPYHAWFNFKRAWNSWKLAKTENPPLFKGYSRSGVTRWRYKH